MVEAPNPALKALEPLVGTWKVTGPEVDGTVRFEWMEGGFYLIQHVDLVQAGNRVTGTEYIGYDPANDNLRSYFFSSGGPGPFGGVALEYVWELGDDTLTIWGGEVGSPANFKGASKGDRISGRWVGPGGGYEATLTRV